MDVISRIILMLVALAVIAGAGVLALRRTRATSGGSIADSLAAVIGRERAGKALGYDYGKLIAETIIGGLQGGGGYWYVEPYCVLVATRSERDRKGLDANDLQIRKQVADRVRAYMDAKKHLVSPKPVSERSFTVHYVTNRHQSVEAVAVVGPRPEEDPEWQALLAKARDGGAEPDRGYDEWPVDGAFTDDGRAGMFIPPTELPDRSPLSAVVLVELGGVQIGSVPLHTPHQSVEVGRSVRAGGNVVVPANETTVSGRHARIELLPDDRFRIENLTGHAGYTTLVDVTGRRVALAPGEKRDAEPGELLLLGRDHRITVTLQGRVTPLIGSPTE